MTRETAGANWSGMMMPMPKQTHMVAAVLVLLATVPLASARAEVIRDDKAKVTLTLPESWTQKVVGKALSIDDPAREVNFTIVMVDAADLKQAAAKAATMLQKMTTRLKLTKGKRLSLGGMAAMGFQGTAQLGKKAIKIALLVTVTPANKGMLVIGLAEAAKYKAHKAEVDGFLASIAPIK